MTLCLGNVTSDVGNNCTQGDVSTPTSVSHPAVDQPSINTEGILEETEQKTNYLVERLVIAVPIVIVVCLYIAGLVILRHRRWRRRRHQEDESARNEISCKYMVYKLKTDHRVRVGTVYSSLH